MMRQGLFFRLAVTLGAVLIVAQLTLGMVILNDTQALIADERRMLAATNVRMLSRGSVDALLAEDYELLEGWVRSAVTSEYHAYALFSDLNGRVLTHTDLSLVAHMVRPLQNNGSLMFRNTMYQGRPVNEVVYPVWAAQQHIAYAHIAYYMDIKPAYRTESLIKMGLTLAGFLVLLLLFMLATLRYFTRPLLQLTEAISMTSGLEKIQKKLDKSLTQRQDEVGILASAFDAMIMRLQGSFAKIIAEEENLKERVEEQTQELRRSNEELEAFSYSVSHDLRAPLRSISGFSQILIEDYSQRLDAQGRDYLSRVGIACKHMNGLISDLLALSRVTLSELNCAEVNVSAVADRVVESLSKLGDERVIDWQIQSDLMADADAKLLAVVLENLLGNAYKYTGKQARARIEFGCNADGEDVVYFVRDNGAGFDMRFVQKLFTPFQRLHNASEFPGHGIGLATVRRIIHRHGGRVWAESIPGKETVFYFTLK